MLRLPMALESPDDWLLAALYLLKEPATTPQIKGVSRALGHELSDEEIDEAIIRLQDAGFAEFLACEKYAISENGRTHAQSLAPQYLLPP